MRERERRWRRGSAKRDEEMSEIHTAEHDAFIKSQLASRKQFWNLRVTDVGRGPERALRERERRWRRGRAKRDEGSSPVSRFEESASVSRAGKQSEGQPQACVGFEVQG